MPACWHYPTSTRPAGQTGLGSTRRARPAPDVRARRRASRSWSLIHHHRVGSSRAVNWRVSHGPARASHGELGEQIVIDDGERELEAVNEKITHFACPLEHTGPPPEQARRHSRGAARASDARKERAVLLTLSVLWPQIHHLPQYCELSEVIGVVAQGEKRTPNDRLVVGKRDRRKDVDAGIGQQPIHPLEVRFDGRDRPLPSGGVGRRIGGRPGFPRAPRGNQPSVSGAFGEGAPTPPEVV